MEETDELTTEIEFMRKSRFEKIKSKFSDISLNAEQTIAEAKDDDILSLSLTFSSPIKVINAEIFNDKKFIDLAF